MNEGNLQVQLSDEARAILQRFETMPAQIGVALAHELDHQNELTIGYAQKNKLSASSSTTLGVRTGLLRRSLRRNDAVVNGNLITGAIGSNVEYAGVHEYGFDGDVQVKSFVRKNRRGDLFSVKKKKISANGISFVKSFTRHMHMPERSFIRSSLQERLPLIGRALSRAIVGALGGGPADGGNDTLLGGTPS
jgi:phage gpG-like protein